MIPEYRVTNWAVGELHTAKGRRLLALANSIARTRTCQEMR